MMVEPARRSKMPSETLEAAGEPAAEAFDVALAEYEKERRKPSKAQAA